MGPHVHSLGITVVPYLDDWLFLHQDRNVLLEHQTTVLQLLTQLGFILSRESKLAPSDPRTFSSRDETSTLPRYDVSSTSTCGTNTDLDQELYVKDQSFILRECFSLGTPKLVIDDDLSRSTQTTL